VAKMVDHASKSLGLVSKSKANGPTCHLVFGGQDHGQICASNLRFLRDNNHFILFMDVQIWT
jgi:hypothetical protein